MSPGGSSRRPPLVIALTFFSIVVTAALLVVVATRPPLTSEDVRRGAAQLERLAAWSSLKSTDPRAVTQLTYTFGGRCGEIVGLALRQSWDRAGEPSRAEAHLWFTVARDETRWLRSPSRPPLASALMVRNDFNSDLVHGPSDDQLTLTLAPQLDEPGAGGALVLNNLAGAAKRPLSRTLNRRLSARLRSTHCRFSDRDLELLTLLAKVLRGRICSSEASVPRCLDVALTLLPTRRSDLYVIQLRALGEQRGVVPFELEIIQWSDAARTAQLQLRPRTATLDLPASLRVIAPLAAGERPSAQQPAVAELRYLPGAKGAKAETRIDLRALLAGTAWLP